MVITIFGATGQVGRLAVHSALAMGHSVRAFSRDISMWIDEDLRNTRLEAIQGYVFNEEQVLGAISGADAVLSVLGGSIDGTDQTRSLGIKNIVAQMKKAAVSRIIALGGAGVLSEQDGSYFLHKDGYPAEYLAVGEEHLKAFLYLKDSGLEWTFVCSPDIVAAAATGRYITAADHAPVPDLHRINAADLAAFMVSELSENKYIRHHVGISNS